MFSFKIFASIASFALAQAQTPSTESLIQSINLAHDQARISEQQTSLADEMSTPTYLENFAVQNCGFKKSTEASLEQKSKCDQLFKRLFAKRLEQRYFAFNHQQVQNKCAESPFVCSDPQALEYLFRKSHNEEIEKSRAEKLRSLAHASQ